MTGTIQAPKSIPTEMMVPNHAGVADNLGDEHVGFDSMTTAPLTNEPSEEAWREAVFTLLDIDDKEADWRHLLKKWTPKLKAAIKTLNALTAPTKFPNTGD